MPSDKVFKNAAHLYFLQLTELPKVHAEKDILQENSKTLKEPVPMSIHNIELPEIQSLKQRYSKVFEEPQTLPPHMGVFDHPISLNPGA